MNTMQYEFDAVVAHLYKQGRPAKEGESCNYRTACGLSCAVGCRIPDAVYVPEMDKPGSDGESSRIYSVLDRFPGVLPVEVQEYKEMFSHLQSVHDCAYLNTNGTFDMESLHARITRVAEKMGLTFTVPTTEGA